MRGVGMDHFSRSEIEEIMLVLGASERMSTSVSLPTSDDGGHGGHGTGMAAVPVRKRKLELPVR